MRGFKPMNGSDAMLAHEQLELERLLREQNREKALPVIRSYARGAGWSKADEETILMSLGLIDSPPPLINRPRR